MNKFAKKALLPLLLVLTSCSTVSTTGVKDYYCGDQLDQNGQIAYNFDLFYRNDPKLGGPDPFVFNNTERDGYYYMLSTVGLYHMARSKDCMNWESVGSALFSCVGDSTNPLKKVLNGNYWAPEIVYDEEQQLYYFFCSANSKQGSTVTNCNSFVGISKNAAGPYYICNFKKQGLSLVGDGGETGVPASALHTFSSSSYSEDFAPYVFLEPGKIQAAFKKTILGSSAGSEKYPDTIDFHPFVDPVTNKKYIYFTSTEGGTYCIFGMEMQDWLTPKWETFNVMSGGGYWNIQTDYNKDLMGPEYETNSVNEGCAVVHHNGKYYMSMSNGNYHNATYSLIQAVSDSPLGPWRKLAIDENGLYMSTQLQGSESVSSSGHNGFVAIDGELYVIYHKHRSFSIGGADRVAAIDKVKWITIDDIYGNELDVMYVNGPLNTVTPRIEKHSNYKNIADEATVSLSKGSIDEISSLDYLNDDYLSTYKTENNVTALVGETQLVETSTIDFEFDTPQSVRAVMAYTSKFETDIFKKISNVTLTYTTKSGSKATKTFSNIPLHETLYEEIEGFNEVVYVEPGANAFVEFDEIANVSKVSLTFDVPNYSIVGISEIVILGAK